MNTLTVQNQSSTRPSKTKYFNMNTIYEVNHNTVLWFGRHKGTKLKDAPAKYLLAIMGYDNLPSSLKHYLKTNAELLKKEQFQPKN